MERYLVFAGDVYYPCGGAYDFQAKFSNYELAKGYCLGITKSNFAWAHILDLQSGEITHFPDTTENNDADIED